MSPAHTECCRVNTQSENRKSQLQLRLLASVCVKSISGRHFSFVCLKKCFQRKKRNGVFSFEQKELREGKEISAETIRPRKINELNSTFAFVHLQVKYLFANDGNENIQSDKKY